MNTRLPDNEKIIQRAQLFLNAKTRSDVATALGFSYNYLLYFLFAKDIESHYVTFEISKKSSKKRQIAAPNDKLKRIQKNLAEILSVIYKPKYCVHAFSFNKSIVTNASPHLQAKHLLKLDLKDFFPSIHFGRVRGLFESKPFEFSRDLSTFIAKICCFNGCLPQGAPTSPIISNMICLKMDIQLSRFALENKCKYTRYADDITFSTNRDKQLAKIIKFNLFDRIRQIFLNSNVNRNIFHFSPYKPEISKELVHIIESLNYFQINKEKIHLSSRRSSKYVTGIKVNSKLNVSRSKVREIRAMLHALRKFGHDKALEDHLSLYKRSATPQQTSFFNIIQGKIAHLSMVRGESDPLILKFRMQLEDARELNGTKKINKRVFERAQDNIRDCRAIIFPEGKTDRIYLQFAYHKLRSLGLLKNLNLFFYNWTVLEGCSAGINDLNSILKKGHLPYFPEIPKIYLFDRDIQNPHKYVTNRPVESPRYWGENSWSFLLPVPDFRTGYGNSVSIEHYFPDSLIFAPDEHGRRIYCCSEFDSGTSTPNGELKFCLINDPNVYFVAKQKKGAYTLLDDGVISGNNNVARTKFSLAIHIAKSGQMPPEASEAFLRLFAIIEGIINRPH